MNKELQDKVWAVLPKEFREEVQELYKAYCAERDKEEPGSNRSSLGGRIAMLQELFGSKCLLDGDSKPSEPKFQPNDKVIFDNVVCTIIQVCYKDCTYTLMEDKTGAFVAWIDESDLEPYTESEDINHFPDPGKMVDLGEQRRYELTKSAMQGRLSNQYGDVLVGRDFEGCCKFCRICRCSYC